MKPALVVRRIARPHACLCEPVYKEESMRKLLVPWLLAIFGLLLSSCSGTPGSEATATPVTSGAAGATATSGGTGTTPVGGGKSITFMTPPWGVPPKQEDLSAFEQQSGVHV